MKNLKFTLSIIATAILSACSSSDNTSGNFVTTDESIVYWKGSSPETFNAGSFDVSSYDIVFENGQLKSGTFTMPISSIKNFNIENLDVREQLLNHLKSPDFFNMALHPEAKFVISSVDPVEASDKDFNYTISGQFTMCGVTKPLTVPALINLENKKLTIESDFLLDRTVWGMNYAADPALGPHHILPNVELHLEVTALSE
jgi:polyisoprenoid-binding protein YceI